MQQTVRQRVVKAKQRVVIVAERRLGGAGQRRGVDNQLRLLGAGINQPVRQHQAPFRVGVHHFHGFAVAIANDIAQTEGVAADHVIRAAEDQLHALVQAARNRERQRAGNQRRAAHVGFHGIHKRGLFNAVAAGVKRNAFADEAGIHRRVRIARRVEIERQQDRRAFRAAAYGMQPHVVLLAQILAFGNAIAHALAADIRQQIHRALRQMLRAHLFRRGVNNIAHPVDDFQAAVELFLLRVVKRRPGDGALAFRAAIAHPERPAFFHIPAIAGKLNVFEPLSVDFAPGALDNAEIVFARQVQSDTVLRKTVQCFFTPASIGRLVGKGNLHGFGHFIFLISPDAQRKRAALWQPVALFCFV